MVVRIVSIDSSLGSSLLVADAGPGTAGTALSVLSRAEQSSPRRHAESLGAMLARVLAAPGVADHPLDAVIAATGPAPFTGLRAGLVTARALGRARGVPVHGVPSLDAVARTALDEADAQGNRPILGMLSLVAFEIPTGVRAWVEDVVVDEAARGQGAGFALVEAAVEHAKNVGARTVDLTSRPSREAANRLYQRAGFQLRETNVYRVTLEQK